MRTQTLFILAGTSAQTLAADAPATPELASHGTAGSRHVAHIYYNLATGERVATLIDGYADVQAPGPHGRVSAAVWISDNKLPCAAYGQSTQYVSHMDTADCVWTTSCDGYLHHDWGDIEQDTVVDCVGVSWSTAHVDVDSDSDGIADGVPGFGATWSWYDADNGFNSSATRQGLLSITLHDLPGYIGIAPVLEYATYTATLDLASSFSSSMVFEIGDTDSIDGAGTGIYNPGAGADLDGDGLADFAYSLIYTQPGTSDFDGDGVPDGDPAALAATGWLVSTPPGQAHQETDGTWVFVPDEEPAGRGTEDAFDLFHDRLGDGMLEFAGTFWYGGFHCSSDPDDLRPYSQFYNVLYGPGDSVICCPVDIFPESPPGQPICSNADGVLNFHDIATYVAWFNADDARADLAPPSGVLNFFDLSAFMTAFSAGCP